MNERQAVTRLTKLLGPKMVYRVSKTAPSKEEREQAVASVQSIRDEYEAAKKAVRERHEFLLKSDAEYQALRKRYEVAQKAKERNFSIRIHHRITVGTSTGLGMYVKAEGDNWAEIVEKLEADASK